MSDSYVNPNANYFDPGQGGNPIGQTSGTSVSTPTTTPTTINTNSIAPAPLAQMPTQPAPQDYAGAITGIKGTVDAINKSITDLQTQQSNQSTQKDPNSLESLFQQYMGSQSAPASASDQYNADYNASGVAEKQAAALASQNKLTAINAQLAGKNYEFNTTIPNQTQQDATGRGVTAAGLAPITAAQQRAKMLEIAPLQLQALITQAEVTGNNNLLSAAQNHLDTIYKIHEQDALAQYEYKNKQIDAVYNFASKQQQAKLDQHKQDTQNAFTQSQALMNDIHSQATAIMQSDPQSAAKLMGLDPNSKTYARDAAMILATVKPDTLRQLQIAQAQATLKKTNKEIAAMGVPTITNPAAAQYAGALSVILGSEKFTKEQKASVVQAVNSGADPVAVLKNQAKQVMTGANQTKIESYETAQSALDSIATDLTDFYAKGGKTGLFTGNYNSVTNKLGNVGDPKLTEIATRIQQNLQIYRNAVSGTAYSVQEGNDIASIFPGINKSEGLNNAVIAGRRKAFADGIDGAYRGVLGTTYDQLKNPVKTSTPPVGSGPILNPQPGVFVRITDH